MLRCGLLLNFFACYYQSIYFYQFNISFTNWKEQYLTMIYDESFLEQISERQKYANMRINQVEQKTNKHTSHNQCRIYH